MKNQEPPLDIQVLLIVSKWWSLKEGAPWRLKNNWRANGMVICNSDWIKALRYLKDRGLVRKLTVKTDEFSPLKQATFTRYQVTEQGYKVLKGLGL